MNTEHEEPLPGILIEEPVQHTLDLVPKTSGSVGFIHERDDAATIYCSRAADHMTPGDALRGVLGSNVDNCDDVHCAHCSNPCYG